MIHQYEMPDNEMWPGIAVCTDSIAMMDKYKTITTQGGTRPS